MYYKQQATWLGRFVDRIIYKIKIMEVNNY